MKTMDETLPTRETPVKERILYIYFDLCTMSSQLMSQMKGSRTGNKQLTYTNFEKGLLEMYTMTTIFKLGVATKKTMTTWTGTKHRIPVNDATILKTIRLFEAFSRELVAMQIIKV